MSWRQSTGRVTCNACRRIMDIGAPFYQGEFTPGTWCEPCAGERLGKFVDGTTALPVRAEPMTGLDPEASETLRGLRERFAPKVRPTWTERE